MIKYTISTKNLLTGEKRTMKDDKTGEPLVLTEKEVDMRIKQLRSNFFFFFFQKEPVNR